MKKISFRYLTLFVFCIIAVSATAQQSYKLDSNNSSLTIAGTSSIHDWEMDVETFSAKTQLSLNENGVNEIQSVEFSCSVEDIESGKRIMNNKAHEALLEDDYPEITFQVNQDDAATFNSGQATLRGDLTIAGQKKEVTVECILNLTGDEQFNVRGELPLKMSDFGIEPPTAMLGTLETADDIVVKFDFRFSNSVSQVSGL